MNATVSPNVTNQRPSPTFLKVINPIFRTLLKTPMSRFAPEHVVILKFAGRKSGKTYEIVIGWHEVEGGHAVFSDAKWTYNFEGGAPAEVIRGSDRRTVTGTLVRDPAQVAPPFQKAIADVGDRNLGVKVEPGHEVTADDVRAIGRRMVVLA